MTLVCKGTKYPKVWSADGKILVRLDHKNCIHQEWDWYRENCICLFLCLMICHGFLLLCVLNWYCNSPLLLNSALVHCVHIHCFCCQCFFLHHMYHCCIFTCIHFLAVYPHNVELTSDKFITNKDWLFPSVCCFYSVVGVMLILLTKVIVFHWCLHM